MNRRRVSALIIAAIASVVLCATASTVAPLRWPHQPEALVMVLAWWAAVAAAGWWLSSVAYWLIVLQNPSTCSPRSMGRTRSLSLPGSRWMAEGLLAAGLIALPACSPDAVAAPTMSLVGDAAESGPTEPTEHLIAVPTSEAATPDPIATAPIATAPTSTEPRIDTTTALSPSTEPPTTQPPTTQRPDSVAGLPTLDAGQSQPKGITPHSVSVQPGDNLWALSAEALEQALGNPPSCELVARYWRQVVATNHVRSGDPDLIRVGETISMPSFSFGDTARESPAGVAG